MRVTVTDGEERFAVLEVDPSEATIGTVKTLIETQWAIPTGAQLITLNGTAIGMNDGTKLSTLELKEDDLLVVLKHSQPQGSHQSLNSSTLSSLDNYTPQQLLQAMEANPAILNALEDTALKEAIHSRNIPAIRLRMIQIQMAKASAIFSQTDKELDENALDVHSQKQIEERIRLGNVEENLRMAIDEMPEAFGRVVMLYVNAEVNGFPVKAFVDSGAQSTIMSVGCAERCGIMRLVDRRFAGQALGVGTAPIVGRVHMAPLKIGRSYYNCTFTILEKNDMDFLFGLDMLRRHQCAIDLHRNALILRKMDGVEEQILGEGHSVHKMNGGNEGRSQLQDNAIEKVTHMGFSREAALAALNASNWDIDMAVSYLLGQHQHIAPL